MVLKSKNKPTDSSMHILGTTPVTHKVYFLARCEQKKKQKCSQGGGHIGMCHAKHTATVLHIVHFCCPY